jgi:phosphatidylserine decarboxylase
MFAKEGYPTIFIVLFLAAIAGFFAFYTPNLFSQTAFGLMGALLLFMLYFFRDPHRDPPKDEDLLLSPADGTVVLIRDTREDEYLHEDVKQISIFLSPLNVHVNRVPVKGTVEYVKYYAGKYLMAWEDHASEENERAHFGVIHPSGTKLFFKQITGFMARRIVYHLKEGDTVEAGDRFGIMKFGSRMDILVPSNVQIQIKEGDKTVAGETIIGKIL